MACLLGGGDAAEAAPRPNIVVIMADDLGFSDIGCYGSEIPTPNLDGLAARGVRFTHFTNTSRCCPSRATLMTGRWAHEVGLGAMVGKGVGPAYTGQLSAVMPTLPELLRDAGYNTAMVGKWHLTLSKSLASGPNGSWPFQRGFEKFYGSMEGAKNYFKPMWFHDQDQPVDEFEDGFFYTDAITERAAEYIRQQDAAKPLFLYTALYAPHFPLQAPDDEIAKFRGAYKRGWDALRQERLKKQRRIGIVPPDTELSNRLEGVPAWDSLDAKKQDEMDLRMAIYAAQVHLLDRGVGRIVKALRETDRLDNTLLLFLSDNGAADAGGVFGNGPADKLGGPDAPIQTAYGKGWATASNTPFRYHKANTHQGGVAAPLILHWPDRLGTEPAMRRDLAHIVDVVPTCLAAAGVDLKSHGGLAGADLLEAPSQNATPRTFYYEHYKSRAVRQGDWKLVNTGKTDTWELYNLRHDPIEANDLASESPDRVRLMHDLWMAWARRYHVRNPPKTP
jgi:arylsulfatase